MSRLNFKPRFAKSKYTGETTPYRWWRGMGGSDWWITCGTSGALIAKGSGYSTAIGMRLFRSLENDWHKRKTGKARA